MILYYIILYILYSNFLAFASSLAVWPLFLLHIFAFQTQIQQMSTIAFFKAPGRYILGYKRIGSNMWIDFVFFFWVGHGGLQLYHIELFTYFRFQRISNNLGTCMVGMVDGGFFLSVYFIHEKPPKKKHSYTGEKGGEKRMCALTKFKFLPC